LHIGIERQPEATESGKARIERCASENRAGKTSWQCDYSAAGRAPARAVHIVDIAARNREVMKIDITKYSKVMHHSSISANLIIRTRERTLQ
jgi:hypothetical protein